MSRNKLLNYLATDLEELQLQKISQEGILDTLSNLFKKNKSTEKSTEKEPIVMLSDYFEFVKSDLVNFDSFSSSSSSIDIPASDGAFFTGDWHIELQKDFQQYQSIFKQIKGPLTQACQYLKNADKKLERFQGNVDHLEDFIKALKEIVKGEPKPLIDRFQEPTHSFLAYNRSGFTKDGSFTNNIEVSYPKEKKQIQPLTNKQFADFRTTLLKLYLLATELEDFEYEILVPALDATDSPFRGYIDNDEVVELINRSVLFYPNFDEKFTYICDELSSRVCELTLAMLSYAKKHVS